MDVQMNTITREHIRIGLSQEDLAEKIGLKSRATVASYENGGEIPGSKLVAMTRLFKCSADYLLGLTDNRTVS
jgi:transcriptional regulator with XRE-family HTH domain